MSAPIPVRLYVGLSGLVARLAYPRVARKLEAQGTSRDRLPERLGRATVARPAGKVMWFHAASVGESLSVLRLITHLGETHPGLSFLVTSGTATSAQIVGDRLPPRCNHQFAPLDSRAAVGRFLQHWSPDAAVFVESELWPNMLRMTKAAGIPMALINARISDRSARNWKRAGRTSRYLMQHFRMIHCQDARTAGHLRDLGLDQARVGQNLKALASAPPVDADQLGRMRGIVGDRPVWLASSTHPGEDEIALTAHKAVLAQDPDALLILVPRHPDRASDVLNLIKTAGFSVAQRSEGHTPGPETQVYLADTLGETGLWYAVAPITCLCGSFAPVGGHNPYEPAQAGSALLHGPLYANFTEVYRDFIKAGASQQVDDPDALADAVCTLLRDDTARETLISNSTALVKAQADGLDQIASDLSKALDLG